MCVYVCVCVWNGDTSVNKISIQCPFIWNRFESNEFPHKSNPVYQFSDVPRHRVGLYQHTELQCTLSRYIGQMEGYKE